MSGWDAGSAGIAPEQVAELLVSPAEPGPGRRGSGYRVSASAVLTAAHVVRDAARVRVRFNADRASEWMTESSVAWSDPTIDAAVVTITPRPQDEGKVMPAEFGRVAERDAVLTCSAMGFPRFKLRHDSTQPLDDGSPSQYRDSMHVVGTIPVLSNRREGTLEVSVAPPELDPDPDRSPWQGMSGAAVFVGGRIIGLVAAHHPSDGPGRLAATRIDRWYERLSPDRLEELRDLIGLPDQQDGLNDVVPPTAGELLEAAYTAQIRDIAPDELIGRDQELEELVKFCAGKDQYQWWQAEPWAGKSALAAWFVLHPPAGISAVSFFVTGRLAGQADSDAFTEALVEQLAAVAHVPIAGSASPAARDRERRYLLDLAAARVADRRGVLLFVVDGLDEDEGANPGGGKPSIAALLPKRLPEPLRVLVFSRPHPGIPGDVPHDHPLRHCTVLQLSPWTYAQDVQLEARRELLERLHGDQLQVDVIAMITAAGGGLTLKELAELIPQPKYLIDEKLGSVFGRSLRTRYPSHRSPQDDAERVYLFAHETLRITAEQELGDDLMPYRRRIDAWADKYRVRGWPASTPRYLLRPYGRLLATSGDLERLIALATDPARHDRMLTYTLGDGAALTEISTAQQLILSQPVPDLAALARLALYRHRLADRNRAVPRELPALWVRLGQQQRAEPLARSITDTNAQAQALAAVAQSLATAGQWDRAEDLARTLANPATLARALAAVVESLANVDQGRAVALAVDAEQAAHRIRDPATQARAFATVAKALAQLDPDRARAIAADAEQAAHRIRDPATQARAFATVAKALAQLDPDRARAIAADAEQATHRIPKPPTRARALAAVIEALASTGEWDRAVHLARTLPSHATQAVALAAVVEAFVQRDPNRALTLATKVENTARRTTVGAQVRALAIVARALAQLDRERATRFAVAAEQAARRTSQATLAGALTEVAEAMACVDSDRASVIAAEAEQVARRTNPGTQAEALAAVTHALARAGEWDRAEDLARRIAKPGIRDEALAAVTEALAKAGQWDRAERLARRRIVNLPIQIRALATVAKALVRVDPDRARAIAGHIEKAALRITSPPHQVRALAAVAEALAHVDLDRSLALAAQAEEAARRVANPATQARALAAVSEALARAGQWDRAEDLAHRIANLPVRTRALAAVAEALASVDLDRSLALAAHAELAAQRIPSHAVRARALAAVSEALARAGQWDRAEDLAQGVANPNDQARAYIAIAASLAVASQGRDGRADAAGLRRRAYRLLAEVMVGGQWLVAMPLLGDISPSEVTSVAEAVRDVNP